jgi:hypothetical protein
MPTPKAQGGEPMKKKFAVKQVENRVDFAVGACATC